MTALEVNMIGNKNMETVSVYIVAV